MKKWQAFLLTAILLALLAVTVWFGWKPLVNLLDLQGDLIQSADSLIALLAAFFALLSGIFSYLSKKNEASAAPMQSVQNNTTQIKTEGGAYVGGGVDTGGGDFVGRDKRIEATHGGVAVNGELHLHLEQTAGQVWRGARPKLSAEAIQQSTVEYLKDILDRHRYLTMKGMGPAENVPLQLKLLDLYVPLQARREVPKGDTWERQLKLAGRSLSEADVEAAQAMRLGEPEPVLNILKEKDGVIVLGDPGAGKTTFLKFLALKLALGEGAQLGLPGRLPILLPLASYANAMRDKNIRLDDFIASYFDEIGCDSPLGGMLAEALSAGKALILLDGLDEVKDLSLRNTVVERVTDFYAFQRRKGNKFVLTSRVIGYRAVRSLAEGMVECTLVDFEEAEIEDFIAKWTSAIEKQALGDSNAARRAAETERRELLDAMKNNEGVRRLAANPLLLTILALMKRQGVTLPERRVQLYDQYVTTLLSTWNRARSLSGRAPGRNLDEVQTTRVLAPLALWMHEVSPGVGLVKRADLHRKLGEIFAGRGADDPEAATHQFLRDVREYAALLLERGPEEYGFIHLTFEEYLAAVALAFLAQGDAAPVVEKLSAHIGEQAWREVTLLAVSYIGIRQNLPRVAGQVAEGLARASRGEAGEAAVIAGEAVLDAWPDGVTLESKEAVIAALLPAMQNEKAAPLTRQRAGRVLGRLGWLSADLDDFIKIPAGKFLYGEDKKELEISHDFWMAKYPVTNLQFARFMQAGGYENKDWWSKDGWDWRTGKGRLEPSYWNHREYANPIFPVVGVTWFEAEAYANWLNRQPLPFERPQGYRVGLPSEQEWEYAARGTDGREYPWKGKFDSRFANTFESGSIGATAVCTYPQGQSPFGVWDMSGNVWEWSGSWYENEQKYRVLRGGSWSYVSRHVRCAARFRDLPDNFLNGIGFRMMVSLGYSAHGS
jgi:formylglycine-generating enzyme required for sulfatase activity